MHKRPPKRRPKQTDAFPDDSVPRVRTSVSFPAPLARNLARLSKRMHVSQSALLSELLEQPIAAMMSIIEVIPETGATAADVKRARGKSVRFIKDAVAEAQELVGEEGNARPRRSR